MALLTKQSIQLQEAIQAVLVKWLVLLLTKTVLWVQFLKLTEFCPFLTIPLWGRPSLQK